VVVAVAGVAQEHRDLRGRRAGRLHVAVLHFEGRVRGVPGVATFWGPGSLVTHEVLYDRDGNLVGSDHPSVVNRDLVEQLAANPNACNSPEGFTHGRFNSTIELFG
jgi:hypothetical protein